MEAIRVSWSDDRLDDLSGTVEGMHGEMRAEFKAVRNEIKAESKALRDEIKAGSKDLRSEMQDLRSELHARFDALQALIVLSICAVIGALAALSAALIAT